MEEYNHSLIIIKPDAVRRGLIGEIIQRFEKKGLIVRGMKTVDTREDNEKVELHYAALSEKEYFPLILESMKGVIVVMVLYGKNCVNVCRKMLGATDPIDALPGTIRGDLALDVGRNVCHASDSINSAIREMIIWEMKEFLVFEGKYKNEFSVPLEHPLKHLVYRV